MDAKQLASLGCKLLGIYALIQSVPLLGNITSLFTFAAADEALQVSVFVAVLIPLFLMVFLGSLLILKSDVFARKIGCESIGKDEQQALSAKELQVIAFSVVGLVMIVLAIPKFFQIGLSVYSLKSAGDQRDIQVLLADNWSFALRTVIQFLLGFFLFIGSKLLSSGWHLLVERLRYEKSM